MRKALKHNAEGTKTQCRTERRLDFLVPWLIEIYLLTFGKRLRPLQNNDYVIFVMVLGCDRIFFNLTSLLACAWCMQVQSGFMAFLQDIQQFKRGKLRYTETIITKVDGQKVSLCFQ